MDDGGRIALAGFLYQFVGTLGLTVSASSDDGNADDPICRIDLDAGSATVRPEVASDALVQLPSLNGGKQIMLVQFKYTGAGLVIKPAELRDIIEKLVKARKDLKVTESSAS